MRNINKRSLHTASPRMKLGPGQAPFGMGIFCALFLFCSQAGFAQILPGGPSLPPVIVTGGSTICFGTTTTLNDAATGGTWSSGNTTVATVGLLTGVVTGAAGGVTQITYTLGSRIAYTTITVTYPIMGGTSVCTGNTMNLTDSTYSGLWSSSNPSVVSVYPVSTSAVSTGQLTGVSAGTATITYGRPGACSVTQVVSVGQNAVGTIGISGLAVSGALGVCVGGAVTVTDTTVGGTWGCSNALATINSSTGVVNGVTAGAATITYTAPGGCWVTKPLTITAAATIPPIVGASALCVGSSTTLTDARPLGVWGSSNSTVATVNTGGTVLGVSAGSLTITYTYMGGCYVTHSMTVNANTVSPIAGSTNVCVGGTAILTDATPSGTWSSQYPAFATIDPSTGTVNGLAVGSTQISYSLGGCFQTMAITVNAASSVGALSGATQLCQGSSVTFSDAVLGGAWSTSNPAVGSITSYGSLKGVSAGTVTITYSRLGCSVMQVDTVNALPASITGSVRECLHGANVIGVDTLTDLTTGGNWSTGNAAIATISAFSATKAVITPVATGVVSIIYTIPSTGCLVSTMDTVYGPAVIIGGNNVCMAPMTYLNLHDATTTSTGGQGTWATSSSAVATVTSGGAVLGVAPGTVTITYSVSFSGLSCYITNSVTVNNAPGPIIGSSATCVGASITLTDTATSGVWTSSNSAIASVGAGTGIVTGAAAGALIITYTKNTCYRTYNVTVGAALPSITGPTSVCANYAQITLTETTSGGTWSESNITGLTEITQTSATTAMVTGVTAGSTVMTYTLGGCTATKGITVLTNGAGTVANTPNVCNGLTTVMTSSGAGGAWTSGNAAVATFTAGVLTPTVTVIGVSAGTTFLTYTIASTGCFKSSVFYVHPQPNAITGTTSICNASSTVLTCSPSGGAWMSSNPYVGSVGATGTVTGVTPGHVTISYSLAGGCSSIIPMEVFPMPYTIAGTASACYTGATNTTVLSDVMKGGVWTASNANVSFPGSTTDSVVVIQGVTAGSIATITYTVGSCYQTKAFTVGSVTPTYTGTNPGPLSICAGGVYDSLTYIPGGGTWTSSNALVAAVSSGRVSGISAGTAIISYNVNGCYAAFQTETVVPSPWPAISGSSAVCMGNSVTLTETMPGKWSSSNPLIATIGSATGTVTGVAPGSVIFTDSAADVSGIHTQGGCVLYFAMDIGNGANTPAAIGSYTTTAMCTGNAMTLTDATTGGVWASSNAAVASINTSGHLAGVSAGTTYITYSLVGCYPTPVLFNVNAVPGPITGVFSVCATGNSALTESSTGGSWVTSNAAIASVTNIAGTEYVVGNAAGSATIDYLLPTGCYSSAAISVGAAGDSVYYNFRSTHYTGFAQCGTAVISLATNNPGGTPAGVWSNFNSSVTSVSGGAVTGVGNGVDTIYYTTPGCPAAKFVDTVNYVTPIGGSFTICLSDTMTLSEATTGGTWAISNANATISGTGLLTSVSGGYDTVTYFITRPITTTDSVCAVTQSIWIDGACTGREASGTTGVQNMNENQVYSLFPNPGNGNMTICQSVAHDGNMQVSVMNYVGEKVYTGSLAFAGGKSQLNLNIASGVYLVLLQDKNGSVQTFKVVVEN